MDGKWGRPDDPTPAEIAVHTAQIRKDWSEQTYRERAGASPRPRWLPPTTGVSDSSSLTDD